VLAVPGSRRQACGGAGGPRRLRDPGPIAAGTGEVPDAAQRGRRWDTDERRVGVGDGRAWLAAIASLAVVAERPGWVAEEPELHLLPQIEAAAGAGPLTVRRASLADDLAFLVELDWVGPADPTRRAVRAALFALVGAIAETVTLVHEVPAARGRTLEILTGERDGDTQFAAHGHLVRLVVGIPSAPPPTG